MQTRMKKSIWTHVNWLQWNHGTIQNARIDLKISNTLSHVIIKFCIDTINYSTNNWFTNFEHLSTQTGERMDFLRRQSPSEWPYRATFRYVVSLFLWRKTELFHININSILVRSFLSFGALTEKGLEKHTCADRPKKSVWAGVVWCGNL